MRRILGDHAGNYDEGSRAVVRGLAYCAVGLLIAVPCALLWIDFIFG
jgi:hypothetical protein